MEQVMGDVTQHYSYIITTWEIHEINKMIA